MTEFDIGSPRINLSLLTATSWLLLGLSVGLYEIYGPNSAGRGWQDLLGVTVLLVATSGVLYATMRVGARFLVYANRRRCAEVRHDRPDVMYTCPARTVGQDGRARPVTTGALAIGRRGVAHSPAASFPFPAEVEVAWSDVRLVRFHPANEFVGRLELTLVDGSTWGWQIRDGTAAVREVLERLQQEPKLAGGDPVPATQTESPAVAGVAPADGPQTEGKVPGLLPGATAGRLFIGGIWISQLGLVGWLPALAVLYLSADRWSSPWALSGIVVGAACNLTGGCLLLIGLFRAKREREAGYATLAFAAGKDPELYYIHPFTGTVLAGPGERRPPIAYRLAAPLTHPWRLGGPRR